MTALKLEVIIRKLEQKEQAIRKTNNVRDTAQTKEFKRKPNSATSQEESTQRI